MAVLVVPAAADLRPLLHVDGAVDLGQRLLDPAERDLGEVAVVPVVGAGLALGRALRSRAVVEEQAALGAARGTADQRLRVLGPAPLRLDVAGDRHALVPVALAAL